MSCRSTAVGKLDRKALPDPVFEAREFRAPQTAVEQVVASVFSEVLGVERVGLDDDFFGLGGNSLIATQVVARLGAALGTRVPVRVLFEASTVGAAGGAGGAGVRWGCRGSVGCAGASGAGAVVVGAAADVVPESVGSGVGGRTTSRWRSGCRDRWMSMRCRRRCRMSSRDTSRCGRCIRRSTGSVSRRCSVPYRRRSSRCVSETVAADEVLGACHGDRDYRFRCDTAGSDQGAAAADHAGRACAGGGGSSHLRVTGSRWGR